MSNTFLNIGPRADGSIPQESIDRLEAIGRWMAVNSEAIHATNASPFPRRLPWGRVTQKNESNGGTTLYLHIWDWPTDGHILLPTLQELPTSGTLLQGGAPTTAGRTTDGISIRLPGKATDPDVSVVKLVFPGRLTITQRPYATATEDGTLNLPALEADTHGAVGGNIRIEGSGKEAYLTDWKPQYRIEYRVKTVQDGKYHIHAEIASTEATKLSIIAGKGSHPIDIPATGEGTHWKTIPLGTLHLPAGESVIELKPDANHWKPFNLRTLILAPAP